MRAKKSEYTCAKSPPALCARINFQKLPRCLFLLFFYTGERQAADFEAVLGQRFRHLESGAQLHLPPGELALLLASGAAGQCFPLQNC